MHHHTPLLIIDLVILISLIINHTEKWGKNKQAAGYNGAHKVLLTFDNRFTILNILYLVISSYKFNFASIWEFDTFRN